MPNTVDVRLRPALEPSQPAAPEYATTCILVRCIVDRVVLHLVVQFSSLPQLVDLGYLTIASLFSVVLQALLVALGIARISIPIQPIAGPAQCPLATPHNQNVVREVVPTSIMTGIYADLAARCPARVSPLPVAPGHVQISIRAPCDVVPARIL
jgi:hypothetical protein